MGVLNFSGEDEEEETEEEGLWRDVCRSAPSDRDGRFADATEGELGLYMSSPVVAISALGFGGVLLGPLLPLPSSSGLLLMSGEWNGFLRVTLAASTRRRLAAGVDMLQKSKNLEISCYAI